MKCPNCNAELKDGTLFCGKCGISLQDLQPGSTEAGNAAETPAKTSSADSAVERNCPKCGTPRKDETTMFCGKCGYKFKTSFANTADTKMRAASSIRNAAGKTGRKYLIPIVAAGAVGILGIGSYFVYNSFFSPKAKFLKIQSEAIVKTYCEPFSELTSPYRDGLSTNLTFTADSGSDSEYSHILRDTKAVLKMDLGKDSFVLDGAIDYKDESLINACFYLDKKTVGFSFPSINDKYYKGDYAELADTNGLKRDGEIITPLNYHDALPSSKVQAKILNRYLSIFTDQINGDNLTVKKDRSINFENSRLSVLSDEFDEKYTKYVYEPSKDDLVKILTKVADTMEKDKDLRAIYDSDMNLSTLSGFSYIFGSRYSKSYDDMVDDFRHSIKSTAKEISNYGLQWTLYTDGKDACLITIGNKNRSEFEMGIFDDKDTHHDAFYFDGFNYANYYEKDKSGLTGYINLDGTTLSYDDVDTGKKSPLGMYYGQYSMNGLNILVEEGKSGTDHIISSYSLGDDFELTVNASSKGTPQKPSGTVVDISDYDEDEMEYLMEEISNDFAEYFQDNEVLSELYRNNRYLF